jgi:hypothetical protein
MRKEGFYRLVSVFKTHPERSDFCHSNTKEDKKRLKLVKNALLDEVLLGNIWTHLEPLKQAVAQTRKAYIERNYVLVGRNMAHILT